ncbi:MAG: hypothetical protein ACI9IP_002792 [Arcticibacterium sp.]|jgi:hypothetical protein
MSQFDFPRINFHGKASINPCTANNNLLLPLVTYDPIEAEAILPPRIYLSEDLLQLNKLGGLPIPETAILQFDKNKSAFIEIDIINSKERYLSWAVTPLGKFNLDKEYHQLYRLVKSRRTNKSILGGVPASWNFYGGMEFAFDNVNVSSIAFFDEELGQRIVTSQDSGLSTDISAILGASLNMNNHKGKNAAVMIDVLPSLAMFSQVFCDSLNLSNGEDILMTGKPSKGSLRFFNPSRVVNKKGVLAASGSFFSIISRENLDHESDNFILNFFENHANSNAKVKGVFIRYNLSEIQENQEIDYEVHGKIGNPAQATIIGSLTPYYEKDMKSIGIGRQLVPEAGQASGINLASFVCRLNEKEKFLSLDILGSIPQEAIGPYEYETLDIGSLAVKLQDSDKNTFNLGEINISPKKLSRQEIFLNGGLIEIPIPDKSNATQNALEKSEIIICKNDVILMRESPVMIVSDQAGLYANAGEEGNKFLTNGNVKELCEVRIFKKGKPLVGEIPMTVMELKIDGVGNTANIKPFMINETFIDGQVLSLPKEVAANAMYVFYPNSSETIAHNLISEIQRTGFFVSLRVLPHKDFGQYLDPNHADYPQEVTFKVLYKELLETFDLIYPMASVITPFTEDYFIRGARFIKNRMSPENWKNSTYMPSSRDMSQNKWLLFCKWFDSLS